MSSINFQRGEIIGKEELIHWNKQLRETINVLMSTIGWGGDGNVLNARGALIRNTLPLDSDLLVSNGTNLVGGYNTIKINAGWGVGSIEDAYVDPIVSSTVDTSVNGIPQVLENIDNLGVLYKVAQDNVEIPGISGLGVGATRYVVVYPRITVFENGTCNITTSNQVTFTDSTIVAKLRDQSSKSPSKLRFFTNTSTAYNSGHVYEVVSIIDDNNITISGVFASSATNLYVAIVGSYDLKEQATLSSATQYLYGYVKGEVEFDTTITGSNGGFPVALLTFAADHSFTITDLRQGYLFGLSNSDAISTVNRDLNGIVSVLTDATTITWNVDNGLNARVVLQGNRALSITNVREGDVGFLTVVQDAVGNRSLTLPVGSKVKGGSLSLSTAANAVDILAFYFDGSYYNWVIGANFS